MGFKRLTPQQSALYLELRERGTIQVTPDNARPLHALKRRGKLRFHRDDQGQRIAVLRLTKVQLRRERRAIQAVTREQQAWDQVMAHLAAREAGGVPFSPWDLPRSSRGRKPKVVETSETRRFWAALAKKPHQV